MCRKASLASYGFIISDAIKFEKKYIGAKERLANSLEENGRYGLSNV